MPYRLSSTLIFCFCIILCRNSRGQSPATVHGGEIIYHVFERSFYDSNGDQIGDLNGLREKLGYLQSLGVNAILMVPIYESDFYHNYFAKNFEKIDPTLGSMSDYIRLVRAVHRRGMKIYMDMETQYVTGKHLWFRDAYRNPGSKYSHYLVWDDSAHTRPEPALYNIGKLHSYDGSVHRVATVNLYSKKVLAYNIRLFSYWADPNHDGKFDDGVDGFRLDHMMDNLDGKGILTNLFHRFWTPLIQAVKKVNPGIIFFAEQANWNSFGFGYLSRGSVDRVFDFRLRMAIASFNKAAIEAAADTSLEMTPRGKQQVVFIENHDLPRFASVVGKSLPKEEIGGAFNLLIGGIPSIYYGQELGMFGGFERYGNTDGNDIPKREAFEWYKSDTGKGMAIWYKNSGPWWDHTNLIPNDGISLEEEKNKPGSLWTFYHNLIRIRQSQPALWKGSYQPLPNDNDSVYSFIRTWGKQEDIVVINLSGESQEVSVNCGHCRFRPHRLQSLYGRQHPLVNGNKFTVRLPGFAINLWKVE